MGRFVVEKTNNGYSFQLLKSDGQVLAFSKSYTTEDSCRKSVASVKANAPVAVVETAADPEKRHPKFLVREVEGGRFTFILTALNGKQLVRGQEYDTAEQCLQAVQDVRENTRGAIVVPK